MTKIPFCPKYTWSCHACILTFRECKITFVLDSYGLYMQNNYIFQNQKIISTYKESCQSKRRFLHHIDQYRISSQLEASLRTMESLTQSQSNMQKKYIRIRKSISKKGQTRFVVFLLHQTTPKRHAVRMCKCNVFWKHL